MPRCASSCANAGVAIAADTARERDNDAKRIRGADDNVIDLELDDTNQYSERCFLDIVKLRGVLHVLFSVLGCKHYLPSASKACFHECIEVGLEDPTAILIHGEHILEYNLRTCLARKLGQVAMAMSGKQRIQKPRRFAAACVGDNIYLFGGFLSYNRRNDTVFKFSLTHRVWSCVFESIPEWRENATAVTVASDVYLIGGNSVSETNRVDRFDTSRECWLDAPALNHSRVFCSAVNVGDFVYVFGGTTNASAEKLDTRSLSAWEIFTDMPVLRDGGCAVVAMGQQLTFIGGYAYLGSNVGKSVTVLDLGSLCWNKLVRMPTEHKDSKAVELDGSIYIFGGAESGVVSRGERLAKVTCSRVGKYYWHVYTDGPVGAWQGREKGGRGYAWTALQGYLQSESGCCFAHLNFERRICSPLSATPKADRRPYTKHGSVADKSSQDAIGLIEHTEHAADLSSTGSTAVVAEQSTQQSACKARNHVVDARVGARCTDLHLRQRFLLLELKFPSFEFCSLLRDGIELKYCRDQLGTLPCQLPCQAFIFVESVEYFLALETAMRHVQGNLQPHHVIASERFEADIWRAIGHLPSNSESKKQDKQELSSSPADVVRTVLHVPEWLLRAVDSTARMITKSDAISQ
eukprot:TRINITY_DN63736_c0_g1_i1.p1 TRINITY_DN63736_c0_g1~~TRINITY_DN63736_c0_g1_i1.p1  ORF type:complete len:635 (+),score=37.01 TRINITY_DN63736_c0_g1_i1:89-1993(+)